MASVTNCAVLRRARVGTFDQWLPFGVTASFFSRKSGVSATPFGFLGATMFVARAVGVILHQDLEKGVCRHERLPCFQIEGFVFRVKGFGFRVEGSGFRV